MGLHFGTTTGMIREFLFSLGGKKSFSDNRDFGIFHKFPRAIKRISLTSNFLPKLLFQNRLFETMIFLCFKQFGIEWDRSQNNIFFHPNPVIRTPDLAHFQFSLKKSIFRKWCFWTFQMILSRLRPLFMSMIF